MSIHISNLHKNFEGRTNGNQNLERFPAIRLVDRRSWLKDASREGHWWKSFELPPPDSPSSISWGRNSGNVEWAPQNPITQRNREAMTASRILGQFWSCAGFPPLLVRLKPSTGLQLRFLHQLHKVAWRNTTTNPNSTIETDNPLILPPVFVM